MATLKLSVDDDLLGRTQTKAKREGTSVEALIRAYLEAYAAGADPESAIRRFLAIAERNDAGQSGSERTWTREGLYQDRLER